MGGWVGTLCFIQRASSPGSLIAVPRLSATVTNHVAVTLSYISLSWYSKELGNCNMASSVSGPLCTLVSRWRSMDGSYPCAVGS